MTDIINAKKGPDATIRSLPSLIKKLRHYNKIVVVGLQRSGTHIASEIISHETNLPLYSEKDFNFTSCTKGEKNISIPIERFIQQHKSFVLQAPALLTQIEELDRENILFIFVVKDPDAIRTSRMRSGWPGEKLEREKYNVPKFTPFFNKDDDLVNIQLKVWGQCSKPRLTNVIEIPVELFSHHSFWVNENQRKNFYISQTSPKGNWKSYQKEL